MAHFIVRYTGRGAPPAEDLQRIRSLAGLHIVNESPRMLLVEGSASSVRALEEMESWVVTPEKMMSPPDPRPKLRS
ncbi:MAG: hypothetical protein L0Z62_30365 [Gemmataceae bacterium]|nr:hypothetical protein [Gemmataceae bacterium]